MEWRIDTSMTNEVQVSDLRATLEASRDHFIKTQVEAAGLAAYAAAGDAPDAKANPSGAASHAKNTEAKAAPLRDKHAERFASLEDDMHLGIDSACAIAEHYAKRQPGKKIFVTASIVGHDNPRHASACEKRMSVHVDQTWKE